MSKKNIQLVTKKPFLYVLIAGGCFLLDLALFSIFKKIFSWVEFGLVVGLAATMARGISSVVNYFLNRNKVFLTTSAKKFDRNSFINYCSLVIFQLVMSIVWTVIVSKILAINVVVSKILVDVIIFIINYFIQKNIIFKSKTNLLDSSMVFLQNNRGLAVVLALYTLLHCLAMCELGVDYNLNSDDLSYVNAGIDLAENGVISMHGVISAQIMPMMNFIIAIFSLFFKGQWLWLSLKILWLVFWLATIVFFFLLVKPFSGTKLATIGCLLLLLPEFIWMNNLILTETPFVLGLLGTFYYSFRLEKTRAISDLIFMTMFYLFTVLLKANFAPYPAFLATYLLLKNYPKSLLIKQIIIAGGIVMVFFVPWVIRNYNLFGKFIPLTYGGGNPMLLGTYQGEGFPNKSPIEYEEYVKTKANPEMKKYLDGGDVPAHKKAYYSLLKDKIVAKKRIADWWSSDKVSFLKSYLLIKPKILVKDVFYWRRIFNIPANILNLVRRLLLIVFCLVVFSILLRKNKSLELLFITFNYVFQILVYSTTFAFDRYNQSIWPLALIVIVSGISYLYISTSQLISGLFRNIKVKNVAD